MDMRIPPLKLKILLESIPLKSRILAGRLAIPVAQQIALRRTCSSVQSHLTLSVGRLSYVFVWVSCCLTCSCRISTELHHQNSPEFHRNSTGISPEFRQNIELCTLKQGITTTRPSHLTPSDPFFFKLRGRGSRLIPCSGEIPMKSW